MGTATAYGRWPSPLSAREAATARVSRADLASDGRFLYWVESRPGEGGRRVVVRTCGEGPPEAVTPPSVSVRSRVNTYGGGAFCLVPGTGGELVYVDQADQRVYLLVPGDAPMCLSPAATGGGEWRHGDLRVVPGGRWVLAVRQLVGRAAGAGGQEIVAFDVQRPGTVATLCTGRDFFASPRPDPNGRWLAWTCWDHPDMPWDACEVWVGELTGGDIPAVGHPRPVDGGRERRGGVSTGQPVWSARDELVYLSDAGGWWQPWRWQPGGRPTQLTADPAEYQGPSWSLGQSTLVVSSGGGLVCCRRREGTDQVGLLDAVSGAFDPVEQPCVTVTALCAHAEGVAWLGSTPAEPTSPWWWPGEGRPGVRVQEDGDLPSALDPALVSAAEAFSLVGRHGWVVHGLFYAPHRRGAHEPSGVRPPLVVFCHGGPTGNADAGFDPVVQFFTTRGLAVAAVDYAGSTGYGRAYRSALWRRWGEADADDCVDAARFLAESGRVDGRRMAVRGTSAGGFTALGALAEGNTFAAAVSWYGVTDLLALAAATHDFESHYTERLVGPLPAATELYRRRSPVQRVATMTGAVLLLQGADDPVVPSTQATAMAAALRRRGVRCELLVFDGEGHGFADADVLSRCLEAEMAFYEELLCDG